MSITMPAQTMVTPRANTQTRSGRSISPQDRQRKRETTSGPAPSPTSCHPLRDGSGLADRDDGAGAGLNQTGGAGKQAANGQ